MFKTNDYKTSQSFGKKDGYKVIKQQFGLWFVFMPDEKIPENLLRAEEEKSRPKRKYKKRQYKLQKKIKKIIKARRLMKRRVGRPKKEA